MQNNNPLAPHLQIYRWQISSLLSITHRIVGVINILAISLICFWSISLLMGETNYKMTEFFLNSFFGKFLVISLCWSFSFHILNEIRHLAWDLGYGYDLKTSKITGLIVIIGSIILGISIFVVGKYII
ncbi:MAG: succinate dehydrogenase, cytochrome b556 subunit [Pelagibacteraceae bacterium]|tara:strand:- start:382 stop:765 length:384 start_codon:yes stop_codon:yes gene_type:complete